MIEQKKSQEKEKGYHWPDRHSNVADFLEAIETDPRIGISHIGLYAVLVTFQKSGVIEAFAKQVMIVAKITARSTYYKLIRELDEYGYLSYMPSYDPRIPSRIAIDSSLDNQQNSQRAGCMDKCRKKAGNDFRPR